MARRWMSAGLFVLLLAACGRDVEPAPAGAADGAFTATSAAVVLAAFDQADSAASSTGDITALKAQEVSPSLDASVASVNRAQAQGSRQRPFQHVDPVFSIPPGDPSCFLAAATLKIAGEELTRVDISHFVRQTAGGWKLSHQVLVAPDAVTAVRAIGRTPGSVEAVVAGRDAVAQQIFERTIAGVPDLTIVGTSPALDNQLAAGWGIYSKQLDAAGISVKRVLDGADWSTCSAITPAGVVTFLTLRVTDTIAPKPGGPAVATLGPQSPDLMATGRRTPVSGKRITVVRVEVFALLQPAQGPASVLGLSDSPVTVTAA